MVNEKQSIDLWTEIQEYHQRTIAPLLNANSLTAGSVYSFTPKSPFVSQVQVCMEATTSELASTTPYTTDRCFLKVFDKSGKNPPMRIECDNKTTAFHVNTLDPEFNHQLIHIPSEHTTTYGLTGSVIMGYFPTDDGHSIPEIIQKEFTYRGY